MRIEAEAARRFLCERLGLAGAHWVDAAPLARLGMVQIDTIRIAGGRNHELVLAARADVPTRGFDARVYGPGGFVEQHYPVHLVRSAWRRRFMEGMAHRAGRYRIAGMSDAEVAALEERVLDRIRAHGPAKARDFDSLRVPGGFDTLKATTIALERLHLAGRLQIAGRSRSFERVFDLTERLHPDACEPVVPGPLDEAAVADLARYALEVLRLATPDALVERVQHHAGPWRGDARRERLRTLTHAALDRIGAVPVEVVVDGEPVAHLVLAEDLDALRAAAEGDAPAPDDPMRIVPPLDNLLFDRPRFARLFGRRFLFEAYKPRRERSFYFAMPLVHRARFAGIVDLRLVEGRRLMVERLEAVPWTEREPLRAALHRLAGLVGAERVSAHARIDAAMRKAVIGRVAAPGS
ncbi:DNA glycosylase AlkZ-like family protein [Salinarimonas chemoclinalis]|uniref:DNA glycosylase AlkZ-like family protein n=1 Tax=Salinarimonas chemoclinalis TaxID=3241599 RepID=UPI00355890B8